jgi:hypothetical protein
VHDRDREGEAERRRCADACLGEGVPQRHPLRKSSHRGPPGYDSAAWQSRMMRAADYYKVVADGRIVGG